MGCIVHRPRNRKHRRSTIDEFQNETPSRPPQRPPLAVFIRRLARRIHSAPSAGGRPTGTSASASGRSTTCGTILGPTATGPPPSAVSTIARIQRAARRRRRRISRLADAAIQTRQWTWSETGMQNKTTAPAGPRYFAVRETEPAGSARLEEVGGPEAGPSCIAMGRKGERYGSGDRIPRARRPGRPGTCRDKLS